MKIYTKLDQTEVLEFLFHPQKEEKRTSTGYSNIDVTLPDNTVLGCRFYIDDTAAPTILFFHGNGETVCDYDDIAPLFNQLGMNFFVATYRGYGWSGGSPTVESMMSDCWQVLYSLQKTMKDMEMSGALFVMGRSIGSASAIELCTDCPESIKGLIIESGFADTLPLLSNLGYDPNLNLLDEKDGFGNRDKIGEVTMPTLILHGSKDSIIPAHQAERLQAFSGARTKKFFIVPGADHNTVLSQGGELYFSTIKGFIDEVTGKTSWRNRRRKSKSNE
ncbi:alpha/beta hydrolase [Desulfopila inferna]|uniref:alpha/beta hydrolase n=1 Tax=Desulfopila inferna TaxID=468528 RepID=UPI001965C4E7|nr:alpha/beta hydrolase [Desulfopila inferna]MBM9602878.1 alpha/beta hydrolase [Desulfopila inferna]